MADVIWQPSERVIRNARITRYTTWLAQEKGIQFDDYDALWRWSVNDLAGFWASIWSYFRVGNDVAEDKVLVEETMPGAAWFPGTTLNYTAHVFKNARSDRPAIIFQSEASELGELGWPELERQVAALANTLRDMGIQPGDRVVAYMPNIPETVVAFLAVASIGGIWSLCAPDLGEDAVVDRFAQIRPSTMFTIDGYQYGGKTHNRESTVGRILARLPSVRNVIVVPQIVGPKHGIILPDLSARLTPIQWRKATSGNYELSPTSVPFDHPLWILYSSGTTGAPKAIVHSHGGIVLEHLKGIGLHMDVGQDDRFHWYSSTAWMMWNIQVGGLLVGATINIYDGNPGWPDMNRLWQFAADSGVTFFGVGAAYFDACRNANLTPASTFPGSKIRAIGSTGSPLLPAAYRWIYEQVGNDVYLISTSGGTDFAGGFVGGVPIMPVYEGEIQCRCLGAAVAAFDHEGHEIVDEVGELVCTKPMPSMPLYFWGDDDGVRYNDSYFDTYPGVWRHGDWIRITARGSAIIYGRSDATINRNGIRMGTSELYSAVEEFPEITDSLVVDLEYLGRDSYLPLFVVLLENVVLNDELRSRINTAIQKSLSPRHVPDDIIAVDDIPRTFSGKKLEIPIRRLLLGQPVEKVINKDTMSNPDSVDFFVSFADSLGAERK